MLSILRRLKITYALYNVFHRKELAHNIPLFRKYGLKKRYFSSLSSKDFKSIERQEWVSPNTLAVTETTLFETADDESKRSILSFEENGYLIIRNYLPAATVDAANNEIDKLLDGGKVKFNDRKKIMFAIHHSALLRNIGEDKKLKDFLGALLGGDAILFQSINFIMGSEQRTHSDSIHMTTYPLGGVWFVSKPDYTVMLAKTQLVGLDGKNYKSDYTEGTGATLYMTDDWGKTLYAFSPDKFKKNNFTKPDFSNNAIWPIFEQTGIKNVPSTLDKSSFDTTNVFGKSQLTFKGWPLYYFGKDSSMRGSTKGVSVPTPGFWPIVNNNSATAPL